MPKKLFQPGESGNPAGRPPKNRALTTILEQAGSQVLDVDDKRITAKRFMAAAVWSIVTTGRAVMPDGRELMVNPGEWLDTVKWIYQHIDGPAKQQLGFEGGIEVHVIYDDDEG